MCMHTCTCMPRSEANVGGICVQVHSCVDYVTGTAAAPVQNSSAHPGTLGGALSLVCEYPMCVDRCLCTPP